MGERGGIANDRHQKPKSDANFLADGKSTIEPERKEKKEKGGERVKKTSNDRTTVERKRKSKKKKKKKKKKQKRIMDDAAATACQNNSKTPVDKKSTYVPPRQEDLADPESEPPWSWMRTAKFPSLPRRSRDGASCCCCWCWHVLERSLFVFLLPLCWRRWR